MIFKQFTYGRSLEVRRDMYRAMHKTLAVRVPMDVDDNRLQARLHVEQVIQGIDREIQNQFNLHPKDHI